MALSATLQQALHGVPVGRGSVDVVCDLPHETPAAVADDGLVQYECIRVGESMTIFEGMPFVGPWLPDLLRCSDCEIASLEDPTDGYGEALVEVGLGWAGGQRVIDASSLRVLEYSPVDEGTDPPMLPVSMLKTTLERRDPGMLRRSRLRISIESLRKRDATELAATIESALQRSEVK